MLWQLAYAEFSFTDVLWPDFDEQCMVNEVKEFQSRNRRFGSVEGRKRLKQRIITAIIALAVFVPFVVIGGWPFTLMIYAIVIIGLFELLRMRDIKLNIIWGSNMACTCSNTNAFTFGKSFV